VPSGYHSVATSVRSGAPVKSPLGAVLRARSTKVRSTEPTRRGPSARRRALSLPAGGGYGGPTVYFLLQAAAIFIERSTFGKRLGLARGLRGRVFALLVLVGPAFLLFHPPFVHAIVVPFVDWLA